MLKNSIESVLSWQKEMVYQLKFKDYKEIKTDQYGFQFVKNGIMIGTEECRCLTCGTPTKYIEVCSEAHFCSDECVKAFYKQVSKFEKLGLDFEDDINKLSSTYRISKEYVGCYLSNFEDDYICHKYNGGCENIDKCREIFEKEGINNKIVDYAE